MNKVAGNFHFALGKGVPGTAVGDAMSTDPFKKKMIGAQHQHRFDMNELRLFNASHEINTLSFGASSLWGSTPLSGHSKYVESGKGQYNYYISVVPTDYISISGRVYKSYQYSYTEKVVEVPVGAHSFPHPGVFFFLDISPLKVTLREESKGFMHFFSTCCAIVGSVWVASTVLERLLSRFASLGSGVKKQKGHSQGGTQMASFGSSNTSSSLPPPPPPSSSSSSLSHNPNPSPPPMYQNTTQQSSVSHRPVAGSTSRASTSSDFSSPSPSQPSPAAVIPSSSPSPASSNFTSPSYNPYDTSQYTTSAVSSSEPAPTAPIPSSGQPHLAQD